MKTSNQTGFTLYELLITIVLVALVLSLGIPNMRAFNQNSRMTSAANDLHSAFHLARSEASRTRASVTLCASANSMAASPTCGGTDSFEDGWIVFRDDDLANPADLPNLVVDTNDAVLMQYPAVNDEITITTNGTRDYFTFAPSGQGRPIAGITPVTSIVLCDDRGNETGPGGRSAARALVVTPLGRATVLRDITQVDAQGGCS